MFEWQSNDRGGDCWEAGGVPDVCKCCKCLSDLFIKLRSSVCDDAWRRDTQQKVHPWQTTGTEKEKRRLSWHASISKGFKKGVMGHYLINAPLSMG
jgi:hypothetical protein